MRRPTAIEHEQVARFHQVFCFWAMAFNRSSVFQKALIVNAADSECSCCAERQHRNNHPARVSVRAHVPSHVCTMTLDVIRRHLSLQCDSVGQRRQEVRDGGNLSAHTACLLAVAQSEMTRRHVLGILLRPWCVEHAAIQAVSVCPAEKLGVVVPVRFGCHDFTPESGFPSALRIMRCILDTGMYPGAFSLRIRKSFARSSYASGNSQFSSFAPTSKKC